MSKNEEELRSLTLEIRRLEQTAGQLQNQINLINAFTRDLTYANVTLETLDNEKKDSELLVPIGSSSYVRARLEDPDTIIVGIGAGVSVEKTRQEAKEIVKKRLEDLEKTRLSLQQQFSQVAERIEQDRDRFEELAAAMQEGKSAQNV